MLAETHEQGSKILYTGRISSVSQRSLRPMCKAFQQTESGPARLSRIIFTSQLRGTLIMPAKSLNSST